MSDKHIFRIHKNRNFTTVSNQPFRNSELSFGARGVMGYLLTKPDNWEVSSVDLINQSPHGRDVIRGYLAELEKHGYLKRVRFHNKENGRWEHQIEIYEEPSIREPIDGYSGDGKPYHVKPDACESENWKSENWKSSAGISGDIVKTEEPKIEKPKIEKETLIAKPAFSRSTAPVVITIRSVKPVVDASGEAVGEPRKWDDWTAYHEQTVFSAIAYVCNQPENMSEGMKKRIGKAGKELKEMGVSNPLHILGWGIAWGERDFRGQKGESPDPQTLVNQWHTTLRRPPVSKGGYSNGKPTVIDALKFINERYGNGSQPTTESSIGRSQTDINDL